MPENATVSALPRNDGQSPDTLSLLRGLCEVARQTAGVDHAWAGLLGEDGVSFLQAHASRSGAQQTGGNVAHPAVKGLLRDIVEGRDVRLDELDACAEALGMPPPARVQLVVAIATPRQTYGCLCLGAGDHATPSNAQEWLVHQLATQLAQTYERTLEERRTQPGGRPEALVPPRSAAGPQAGFDERQVHSQRMMEVGRLVGGVAHDFNNQLTTILGHGEIVLRKLQAESPLQGHVREMLDAVDRAAGLTRQLLAFSHRQAAPPRVVDLNAAVSEMARMLGRLIGDHIRLTTTLASDLDRVEADPGLLEQVVVNLIVDARDAIGEAGYINVVTTRVSSEDAASVAPGPRTRAGRHVLLAVTGSGRDADTTPRVLGLKPTALTRRAESPGLGLAAVRGVVEQLGGHLVAEAGAGTSTAFRVYLPAVEQEQQAAPAEAPFAALPRGTETLLLVEDEPAVRGLEVCVLREQGYRVLEAADGQEALEMLKSQLEPAPDLLVTDLVMPRLGGRELADLARRLFPQMRILCISGDAGDAGTTDAPDFAGAVFLHKPFTLEELTGKVREALEGRPG